MLSRDTEVPGSTVDMPLPTVVPGADAVALAGSPATAPSPLGAYDARLPANKGRAQDAFRQIVEDLATCAYDVVPPALPLGADDVLSYSDPVAIPPAQAVTYTIPPAAAGTCTKAGDTGNGWGVDAATPTRIRICGAKCDEYKSRPQEGLGVEPPVQGARAGGPGLLPQEGVRPDAVRSVRTRPRYGPNIIPMNGPTKTCVPVASS